MSATSARTSRICSVHRWCCRSCRGPGSSQSRTSSSMAAVTLELAGTRVLRRSRLWRGLLSMAAAFLVLGRAHAATPAPVEVKVVVVTMFEVGKDEGDEAGEFQLWKERQKLTTRYPFAHFHDLFFNPKTGVLGV